MNDPNVAPSIETAKGDYGLVDKIRFGAQTLILGAQISPLNEAAKFAALGATLSAGGGPIEAAAVFGGATLFIEGAAVQPAASLYSTDRASKLTSKVYQKLEDWNVDKVADNKLVQTGLGMGGGSSIAMAAKKLSEPDIDKKSLRDYGVKMTLGLGAMTAVQGGLAAEGIASPDTKSISGAVLVFAGALALQKWAKGRASKDVSSKEYYLEAAALSAKGPQAEGLSVPDMEKVFEDDNTVFIQAGKGKAWPLLTPLKNNTEYLQSFFDDNYPDKQQLYLSLPPDMTKKQRKAAIASLEIALQEPNVQIVFDESVEDKNVEDFLAQAQIEGVDINNFVDEKNSTPASVIHFEGRTDLMMTNEDGQVTNLREAYDKIGPITDPENADSSTVLLGAEEIEQSRDRLWQIYEGQFSALVENHPARQIQTKDELFAMLSDPDTLTVAQQVDGDIVSFSMFVGNIESCDWLNVDYYKNRYKDEDSHVLYFPGIATDVEKQGNKYALNLIKLIAEMIGKSGKNARIVFQCTNISADYIPKIVETATSASGMGDINISEMYRYSYRAIES